MNTPTRPRAIFVVALFSWLIIACETGRVGGRLDTLPSAPEAPPEHEETVSSATALEGLADSMDGGGASLIRAGSPWVPEYRRVAWQGVIRSPDGTWRVGMVVPRSVMAREMCGERQVEVVALDPTGARFAVPVAAALHEGPVHAISAGTWTVAPGDSVMFPRPVMGSYELHARGRIDSVTFGRPVRTYSLDFVESDDEHARGMRIWAGVLGEVTPSVEWIGDLNNDGDGDVLVVVPAEGYSQTLRLLLSDYSGEEAAFRVAGELPITDC